MRWFGLMLLLVTGSAQALVEHLSVNRVEVEQGQPVSIYVNVVADFSSKQQLRFYLQQDGELTPLRYRQVNDFQLQLISSAPLGVGAELLASTWLHVTDDALGRFKLVAIGSHASPNDKSAVVAVATTKQSNPAPKAKAAPQPVATSQPKPAPVVAQIKPVSASSAAVATTKSTPNYPTGEQCFLRQGESLWRAAERLAPAFGLGRYGMLWALYDSNPAHFNGSPQIMRSSELICPSQMIVSRHQNEADAKRRYQLASR